MPRLKPTPQQESTAKVAKSEARRGAERITTSSTAEYFAKNLQQVGFSSPTKAVLTTLKEAVDNALDACEEHGLLPEIRVVVEKLGAGSLKNTDQLRVVVHDNGPGIAADDVPKVFGEYLASSKFGRGRCSRGQQGIGISAATTWAQQTSATGARVVTKTARDAKALACVVEVDIKNNKGRLREKKLIAWDRPHGTTVEFVFDGRVQLNGEAGLLNYLKGTALLNPHMSLHFQLPDMEPQTFERVSTEVPRIPEALAPHPHTMKLGEFIDHARLFGRMSVRVWLKTGFSRVGDSVITALVQDRTVPQSLLDRQLVSLGEADFKALYAALQQAELKAPPTDSVVSVGEESLAKSIRRLGEVDFFAVVTRKPTICDFKPVQVEVAIARLQERVGEGDEPVQVLRFANRVPLQFDKASCAIVKALTSVNWKTYGLRQPREALPTGPYIVAVSVVSPFIKFKNASKETIDAADELVEELRRGLMQAGQRLARHLRREIKARELEERLNHIEQFGPILVEGLCRIIKAPELRKKRAEDGLRKILGRDADAAQGELDVADARLEEHLATQKYLGEEHFERAVNESEGMGSADAPTEDLKPIKKKKSKVIRLDAKAKKVSKKAAKGRGK